MCKAGKKEFLKLILSLCVFLLFSSGFGAHAQGNLLQNPSFEEWISGRRLPLHWRRNSGTFEYSEESERGKASIRFIASKDQEASTFQTVDIDGEQSLSLHARVRTEGSGRAWMSFSANDEEGNRLPRPPRYYSGVIRDQPEWTDLRWSFTTPPGTRRINIVIRCRSYDGQPGSAWIDEISLRREGITLGNDYLEVFINQMNIGGRIQNLRLKDEQAAELVYWDGPFTAGGFSAEIFPAERAPGLLRDTVYEVLEVDETGRRAVLGYEFRQAEYEGLRLEKEYTIPEEGAFISVQLSLLNQGNREIPASLRVKNVLPASMGMFTYPAEGYVGAYDMSTDTAQRGSWELTDIEDGWIAHTMPNKESGVVFIFDKAELDNAFCWLGGPAGSLNTLEWYYREQELAPGGEWRTSYRIVPIASGAPVFSADEEIIAGLLPLDIPVDGGARLDVTPYGGSRRWSLEVEGRSQQTGTNKFRHVFESAPMKAEQVELPWDGERLMDIELAAESRDSRHSVFLHEQARFVMIDAGLELPDAPVEESALADEVALFFPFGAYLRGGYGSDGQEWGGGNQHARRHFRLYRQNYMNTVTGELPMYQRSLEEFQRTGSDWYAELARKHDMRVIPRSSTFSFRCREDGQLVFIENITREQAITEWRKRYFADIDKLLRLYAEEYNDVILAYDISDEPHARFIPWYIHKRDVFNEINPKRPAMPILMWHQVEYMPYVPIYYGDIYPIYTEERGRDPWAAGRNTRRLVDRARGEKPVWVMPQAFGWERWALPDEAETRYMAYAFFANGAKALIYHGAEHHARWLINRGYYRIFITNHGTWTREWHVLGEVSKHLTAVGPATMDYLPADDTDITVDCGEIRREKYSGPAIIANVLASRGKGGGLLLVVQNQDMDASHSGTLRLPAAEGDVRVLYDLKELKQITRVGARGASVNISLEQPGDALFLYLGTEEETARVVSAVHRQRYLNEKAIFNIDFELAEQNDADARMAKRAFGDAEREYSAGRYERAHLGIMSARGEIESAIRNAVPLAEAKEAAEAARQSLSEVTELYGIHLETITPPELVRGTGRAQRFSAGTGKRPEEVDVMVEKTAELIRRLNQAEDRLYQGQAAQVADELRNVRVEAERHRDEVLLKVAQLAGR